MGKVQQEEIKLTKLLIQGDTSSFRIIHKNHRPKMLAFSYGLLKSKEDAEEVVQDAFVKLWENRKNLDENRSVAGYLFAIVQNQTLKKLRSKAKIHFLQEFPETLVSTFQADDGLHYQELKEVFAQILEQLPEQKRKIFELKRSGGLTNKEVADKLKISIKAVEKHMTQTLKFINLHFHKYKNCFLPIFLLIKVCV